MSSPSPLIGGGAGELVEVAWWPCLLGGRAGSGASGAFEQNLGEPPGGRPSVRDTPQVAESDN